MEQMEAAISEFPPDFDRAPYASAWSSSDPAARNRAMLVRSNMDDLHNLCRSLIALSVRVAQDAGAIPSDRRTPAAEQLRAQGHYSREAELVMQEALELRNASQHEYWILSADDVHAAVNRQRQHLPAFIADLGVWIDGLPPL